MTEPTITCPKCKEEIKLTESLAAPIVESTRREFKERLAKKDADVAKRENVLDEREEALSKAKETIDDQVTERVQKERATIVTEEAKKSQTDPCNRPRTKSKGGHRPSGYFETT